MLTALPWILAVGLAAATAQAPAPPAPAVKATPVREVPLPKMDGEHLKVFVREVIYPPGASSTAHRHPCPVVGYVISGTMRMQVSDGPVTEYKPGESFVEMPTDVHRMATNPSPDTPARFLVTFVCDKDTPLSVPVP